MSSVSSMVMTEPLLECLNARSAAVIALLCATSSFSNPANSSLRGRTLNDSADFERLGLVETVLDRRESMVGGSSQAKKVP